MMKIGLVIDSSPETLVAAQFAVKLAALTDKSLLAYSFVDSKKLLDATGFAGAGLCGSGVFLDGYEQMVKILMSISESLMEALRSRAGGSGVRLEEHISVDDPVSVICNGMKSNTLLVLGGHTSNLKLAKTIFENKQCPVAIFEPHPDQDGSPRLTLMMNRTEDMEQLIDLLERLPGDMRLVVPDRRTRVFSGNPFYSTADVA